MSKRLQKKHDIRETWFSRMTTGTDGAQKQAPFFLLLSIAVLAMVGLGIALRKPQAPMIPEPEVPPMEAGYQGPRNALTGEPTSEDVRPAVIAVMVENPVDVRPQSGVNRAFMVFEAPVEGNITRWMVLFGADVEIKEVGPVRSARPYYVEWALGWDALYAHVGGSPEALDLIHAQGVHDLDEFFWGSTFWRSQRTGAPHNVFTESVRLTAAWDKIVTDVVVYGDRLFKDNLAVEERVAAQTVHVDFSHSQYDVYWEYQPESNDYLRRQTGLVSKMRDGSPLIANNVAVMFTDVETIDEKGRKRIRTIGEGDATVVQDGVLIEATWEKTSRDAMLRFYRKDGEEITWNPGVTWVEVLPIGHTVEEL
ncbi:hypothetical protein COV06_02380 [Candidatus Uhrbacteria bacterium CG10_big_fil_rev_8_21_14_0_10_50_16]|uniref:DUF3048 domain-containing protein n=1 Tax=Candidatus Uhrbacteria bacterium CG10_big_fil_rev_8_21_14_0_10_50_16 TaxID=1975039 RepID=A0A2H0RMB1_9BACT|nr:MAG: hypothetical protein COV06_02380 [Candidatus Uhrbacteria bacterium CG10_big_fil_rev_8_21_14_0_10_50_16]